MNKQKILAISIIAILGSLVVGGTSAYYTFTERTHNIITTSGIAIELIEDTDEIGADGRPIPFTNIEGAMPGDKISKIPKVKNIDDGDAFVRMKVIAGIEKENGETEEIPLKTFELDISRSWSPKDGYYYYMRPLHSGETTMQLFTTVSIPDSLPDRYQHATFSLTIYAEAVQVANNGESALEAQGWPEE
jgi:hypothetical protein